MKLLSPFYGKQLEYGAKLMDLLGWQLTEVYTSVDEEYWMIRERLALLITLFRAQ